MDKLKAFEVFVTIVERGSLTRAADALRMSPTMVSTYLKRLEAYLGQKLLDRTTRRIDLTREGRRFLDAARRILTDVKAAEDAARGVRSEPRGRVRIDSPATIGRRYLLPRLPAFHNRFPEIGVDLSFSDRAVTSMPRGFDVLIRIGPVAGVDAEVRVLGETRYVHVAAPAYVEQHGMPTHPAELERHRCIVYAATEASDGFRWSFTNGQDTRWYRPPVVMSFNDGDALAAMAIAGVGITRTLEMMVAEELVDGRLLPVFPDVESEWLPILAIAPVDRATVPAVAAVLDFLQSMPWPRMGAA